MAAGLDDGNRSYLLIQAEDFNGCTWLAGKFFDQT